MLRPALIFIALTIALGARAADARQGPAAPGTSPPPPAQSAGPRASEPDVRRLVELIGIVEKELASIDGVIMMWKQQMPAVPEKVWPEVKAEFVKSFNREAIIATYVPIYSGHFDAAEIQQLIAFYSSPVGKKLVAAAPFIEAAAFLSGMERGKEVGERLREILKARGYRVPST